MTYLAKIRPHYVTFGAVVLVLIATANDANAQSAIIADFEGDPNNWLSLTTPQADPVPDPPTQAAIMTDGPTGNYLRLTHLTGGNHNAFMNDQIFSGGASEGLHIAFDFRMTGDQANGDAGGCCDSAADGLGAGIFFVDGGQWPSSGVFNPMAGANGLPGSIWERPDVPFSVTVGLDIFQNIDQVNVQVNPGIGTGGNVANVDVAADFGLDLNNQTWHQVQIIFSGTGNVSVDIVEDVYGNATTHSVLAGQATGLDMANLPSFRFGAGGRTGGAYTEGDIDNFLAGPGTSVGAGLQADFDDSGTTDETDFGILSGNFGQSPAQKPDGDANRNGEVDLRDFRVWKGENGCTEDAEGNPICPEGGHAVATATPEPSTVALSLLALAGLGAARRKRK